MEYFKIAIFMNINLLKLNWKLFYSIKSEISLFNFFNSLKKNKKKSSGANIAHL